MKERPILFSAPMVRAILAGRKTVTRRAVRDGWFRCLDPEDPSDRATAAQRCPYGVPGDRLWVRETFASSVPGCEPQGGCSYRADHQDPRGDGPAHPMRWTPSIHMPRWASRITLDVVDVRVERLRDIDEWDANAEGVAGWVHDERCETARDGFRVLWEDINGAGSWAANPWVWRVEFRRLP